MLTYHNSTSNLKSPFEFTEIVKELKNNPHSATQAKFRKQKSISYFLGISTTQIPRKSLILYSFALSLG